MRRIRVIFGSLGLRTPWIDSSEIWHVWLYLASDPAGKIRLPQIGRAGRWMKLYPVFVTDHSVQGVSKVPGQLWLAITSIKVNQFSRFFTVKFRKDLRRKMRLKSPPPLKSAAALPCEIYVFNYTAFTAQLIQFKVMKTFNYSKRSRGMLFLCLSTQINLHHVLKMYAVGTYM